MHSKLQREIRRRQAALPAERPATFQGGGAAMTVHIRDRMERLRGEDRQVCISIFRLLNNYERLQVLEMYERKANSR